MQSKPMQNQSIQAQSIQAQSSADSAIALENQYGAHNYAPLPILLTRGQGVWLYDVAGRRYLDMMSAYSAVSFGHSHPRLVAACIEQAQRLAVTSRAFYNDQLGRFLEKLCQVVGLPKALPMNTGVEAVETAVKAARKWGYTVKGIPANCAQIIVAAGNFAGRTTTAISFSSEAQYQAGFGPLTPGFVTVPYGDAAALEAAITPHTAAFIVEPIQGEAGIIVPPPGYLTECRKICSAHQVLLICDEIQTGLGRTGRILCGQHEDIQPDAVLLGKALGGGLLPVSAFVARAEIMQVFKPGDHGSTFGGNPLAAAVGYAALQVLREEKLSENAQTMGALLIDGLKRIQHPAIREVRGRGLFIGVELDPAILPARALCERLMQAGLLTKDTHQTVLRFAPPLIIDAAQIDIALEIIRGVFENIETPLLQNSAR